MRVLIIVVTVVVAAPACAGDNGLLDRFKLQNERGRDKLKAEIKDVLDQAQALEKDEPARALGLLQDTRDRLLQKGQLTEKDDRALAEPLWERIYALRAVVRGQQADELRGSLTEYKEYVRRMSAEFATLRKALIAPTKEVPPGGPAIIAMQNGKLVVGWLHEPPTVVVNVTVSDQEFLYAPGVVAGLQTADAFFQYDPGAKIFVRFSAPEFFLTAIASYPAARRPGFWLSWKEVAPPAGFDKRSAGAVGAALFARGAGVLMATWASPTARRPELGRAGGNEMARMYRDVVVELQVQDAFSKLKREDQTRFRDVIMTFLERRPQDHPLSADEIVRFSDLLAEIYPDRRADAVSFAHLLNRFFERNSGQKK